MTSDTTDMRLIRMFIDGPEVFLKRHCSDIDLRGDTLYHIISLRESLDRVQMRKATSGLAAPRPGVHCGMSAMDQRSLLLGEID